MQAISRITGNSRPGAEVRPIPIAVIGRAAQPRNLPDGQFVLLGQKCAGKLPLGRQSHCTAATTTYPKRVSRKVKMRPVELSALGEGL